MRVRWIGLALALVLLALAAGYGLASRSDGSPSQVGAARPIAAVEPAWPAEPPKVVPDSTFPALAPGARTHPVTVGAAAFPLTVPVPNGWVRSNSAPNEWKWYPANDFEYNTYFLRVVQVGPHQAIPATLARRISDLEDAESVKDLHIEAQTADSFTATYVNDEHLRLSMERVLPAPDGTAMVWVALIGRESDREGMAELFPRITNGVTVS